MAKKICVLNHTGVSADPGGVATCYVLEEALRRRFGDDLHLERVHRQSEDLFTPSGGSEDFVAALRRVRRNRALQDALCGADLVVLNADDIFAGPNEAQGGWTWLAAVRMAKEDYAKPVCVVNAALPREEGSFTETVGAVLSDVDHLAVRDAAGFEMAQRLGLSQARRCAHAIFLLPTGLSPQVERYLEAKYGLWGASRNERRLLMAASASVTCATLARWRLAYSTLVERLTENHAPLKVHFLASLDTGLDGAVGSYLQTCHDNVTMLDAGVTPADASWLVAHADVTVSGRFSLSALAVLFGTPTFLVAGDASASTSLREVGDAAAYVLPEIGDVERIVASSRAAFSHERLPRQEQVRRQAAWRRLAAENFPEPHPDGQYSDKEVDFPEYVRQVEFVLSCLQVREAALRREARLQRQSLEFRENLTSQLQEEVKDLTLERDKYLERSEEIERSKAYKVGSALRSTAHAVMPWLARKAQREMAARRERRRAQRRAVEESRRGQHPSVPRFHPAEIKVLHFSRTPLAGSPVRVSRILDASPEISSICVSGKAVYSDGRRFPFDIEYNDRSEDEIRRHIEGLIEEADVLHFHNESYWNLPALFAEWIGRKPCCVQWHSGPDEIGHRLGMTVEEVSRWNEVPVLVVAQKQARLYPHAIPVPNAVPLWEVPYQPLPRDTGRLHIVFTPTDDVGRWSRVCGDKGLREVLAALDAIREHHADAVEVHIVRGVPLKECLRIKRLCHVCIDDIKSGGYHLSSLEGLAMGCVTIANLDPEMRAFLAAYTGCPERDLPWFPASPDNLLERLQRLIGDRRLVEKTGLMSRLWMETYWNEAFVVRKFREAYRKVLRLF